jgi:hypothetical protein
MEDLDMVRVVEQLDPRRTAVTRGTKREGLPRTVARMVAWRTVLRPRLRSLLKARRPDVVVVPNDIMFPYSQYIELLRAASIPFVLQQEGILFELPVSHTRFYGSGGAARIAAWGVPYQDYFVSVGVATDVVAITGSPRHDAIRREDYAEKAALLRQQLAAEACLVTVPTTPVDKPGGHCTTAEKLAAFGEFLEKLSPLAQRTPLRLVVKPHRGESANEYRRVVMSSPLNGDAAVITDVDLYPLLVASDAVLVNGSTVGLEALLLGAPIGLLPVPNAGFLHDFVEADVAVPIDIGSSTSEAVEHVVNRNLDDSLRLSYLDAHLANRGRAAEHVAAVITSAA